MVAVALVYCSWGNSFLSCVGGNDKILYKWGKVVKEGMMKRNDYLYGIVLIGILQFVTGCATVHRSHIYKPVNVTVDSTLNAKIDAGTNKKLRGTSRGTYLFGFIKLSGPNKYADGYGGIGYIGNSKSAAAYDALSKSEGDLLISPRYRIVEKNYLLYQTVEVDVSGYEGKIKSIENFEMDKGKIELK